MRESSCRGQAAKCLQMSYIHRRDAESRMLCGISFDTGPTYEFRHQRRERESENLGMIGRLETTLFTTLSPKARAPTLLMSTAPCVSIFKPSSVPRAWISPLPRLVFVNNIRREDRFLLGATRSPSGVTREGSSVGGRALGSRSDT